jgi:membrane protein implicated in regulation of membrane protease activity
MSPSPALFPIGIGWAVCCGVGVWLFMRWRRERNKPINRLRRQAEQARRTAYELRGRVPDIPDEAARPVMGLSTVLLSLAVFLWQQSQSRSRSRSQEASERMGKAARQARQKVSDADWQQRLVLLKKRWNPSRLQLERG